ncbi:MAG: acyl-CoA reductase [Bacteroidales bacterium]|nr:acyl-CoA reductase [Bacteroidales bacterium]
MADLHQAILQQSIKNHWFTVIFINNAISAIAEMLKSEELSKLERYDQNREDLDFEKGEKIAVISAGNIPLAGFHDFFAVLVSGNKYMGKLSSQDNILLPVIANLLIEIEPSFQERISFVEKLADFDKIIATGSNNSSRYFEYYFGKYPHILRKNRNSLAILTGNETCEELERLFDDIFLYFGLGCRSISLLWVPKEYDFNKLITVFGEKSTEIAQHHHYLNNIDYQKTIRLMNQTPFIDTGIALLMEKRELPTPIGIIHYQYYSDLEEVKQFMIEHCDEIQCAVGNNIPIENVAALGRAQFPNIIDFADGIDTILWAAKSTKS